jgi:hypothetical protein
MSATEDGRVDQALVLAETSLSAARLAVLPRDVGRGGVTTRPD